VAALQRLIAASGPAFVIYDLEVTSWEGALARDWSGPGEFPEIIQVGAIKLTGAAGHAELASFSCLVRPTKNPLLSGYITELTGITQADVETKGVPFVEALSGFARFAAGCRAFSNGSDNQWLGANCRLHGLPNPFAETGGVSSAVSRALGAGDRVRAQALAFHAAVIGGGAGAAFLTLFLLLGPALYRLLGGCAGALEQALAYSNVFFLGAPGIWLMNTAMSVLRGTGNMSIPSATMLAVAGTQAVLGGCLGHGLGPFPRLGMTGVALGATLAFSSGALFLLWFLLSGRARLTLRLRGVAARREMFHDILKVGAVACLSSLQTVLTVVILTALVARLGTEALAGYGIGARLEFLLVPTTFAIGVACVPLVGMAIGARDVARARRVAWISGGLAAAVIGTIGAVVTVAPDLWASLFTDDPGARQAAHTYLRWAGPGYGFFALGLCLYFASQGAGQVLGPVLTGTLRLAIVAGGGWLLVVTQAPVWALFALVSAAMVVYGLSTAWVIHQARWGR
jgi:putative MATE family efflux protein